MEMSGGGTASFLHLRVIVAITMVSILCPTTLAAVPNQDETVIPLTIKEIHKVMRNDSPSGRHQNIQVVLDPHDPILEAENYLLSLQTVDNETVPYLVYDFYEFPEPNATVVEFEGNFVDAIAVFITAMKGPETLANGFIHVDIIDPGSKVAWVGDPKAPVLRVDPGEMDEVDIPGHPPCPGNASVPCYYFGLSGPPLPRCQDLGVLLFCDDIITEIAGPSEPPTFILYDREDLNVVVRPSSSHMEVVVSLPGNNTILSPDGFACLPAYMATCGQNLDVPETVDNFDVLIVVLDDEGYVNVSGASNFEVYRATIDRLSNDVYKVSLDPSNPPGYYAIWFNTEAEIECGGDSEATPECNAFFAKVIYDDYNITILKNDETKMVCYSMPHDAPPPRSTARSITALSETWLSRIEVETQNQIDSVEFITFNQTVATTSQKVVPRNTTSGYTVDVASREGPNWNFVALGYGSNGSLLEVAQAYVCLEDLDANIAEVGRDGSNISSLRVAVESIHEVTLENVGRCSWFESPCYFPMVAEAAMESTTYCINITNKAEMSSQTQYGTILQCGDDFTPFRPFEGNYTIAFNDFYEIVVRGAFPTNVTEVTVFEPQDPFEDLSLGKTTCTTSKASEQVCAQAILFQETLHPVNVLVAVVDYDGVVLGSKQTVFNFPRESSSNFWTTFAIVGGVVLGVVIVGFVAVVIKRRK